MSANIQRPTFMNIRIRTATTAQTPEEAARLAAYNRYLAELADEDAAAASASGRPGPPA